MSATKWLPSKETHSFALRPSTVALAANRTSGLGSTTSAGTTDGGAETIDAETACKSLPALFSEENVAVAPLIL